MSLLKNYRLAKGLTQRDIASKVGITEMSYQRYEHGQRTPDVRTAIRIAQVLGVGNVNELWKGNPVSTQ